MATTAIYRGPNIGYSLTNDDMIWFARALGGETWGGADREDAKWHFWSWMDRFQLVRGNWQHSDGVPLEGQFGSKLVQYHSQAVSPKWLSLDGEKCKKYPSNCKPDMMKNRAKWSVRTQEQLVNDGMWKYAVEAQEGTLERPTAEAMYDFAACSYVATQGRPCTGLAFGGQCFLTLNCLKADELKSLVKNKDGSLPSAVITGITPSTIGKTVLGVLFGAAVVWALWILKPWERGKRGK